MEATLEAQYLAYNKDKNWKGGLHGEELGLIRVSKKNYGEVGELGEVWPKLDGMEEIKVKPGLKAD